MSDFHSFIFSAITTFKLNVTTQDGLLQIPLVVPAITLGGRESKVVVTDYTFGSSKLLFSTAQIFYAGIIDKRDILFLHGTISQDHEAALVLTGTPNKVQIIQSSLVKFTTTSNSSLVSGTTIVSFLSGINGLVTVWDSDTQLVLYADSATAATFWSPVIAGPSDDPFANYWGLGTNQSILVGGPYLVRDARLSGSTLALRGDLKTDAMLTVIAPRNVRYITWNGEPVSGDFSVASSLSSIGGFVGQLQMRHSLTAGIKVPKLTRWKFKDSLPEIQESFNDDIWAVANHTTTNIPLKPYYGDGRILYGCDYGL
jgi:Beta-galactosidase, domain 2/Beta-galactosidase, domain 3